MNKVSLTRRKFLLSTGIAATGLIVGCSVTRANEIGYSTVAGALLSKLRLIARLFFTCPTTKWGRGFSTV
jgi:hypothetical protein